MTARSLGVASTLALGLLAVGLGAGAAPADLNSCQTIHSGGSYVVTQDLSNPAGHCLILEADRVTIDLNGFSASGSGSGITSAGGQTRFLTVIRNGGIVGGGSNAIDLPQGRSTVVERVRAATGNGWAILLGEEAMVSAVRRALADRWGSGRSSVATVAWEGWSSPPSRRIPPSR